MAYTYDIKLSKNDRKVEINPNWMFTFLRWKNRDPFHYPQIDAKELLKPLIVLNDCIQFNIRTNKNTLTPSFHATFVGTDINYSTAIAPGDFVTINIVNSQEKISDLYDRAKNLNAINGFDDGFKGLFKISSVRRQLTTGPDGMKRQMFHIQGFAFTELNNVIYFNPYLVSQNKGSQAWIAQLGNRWNQFLATIDPLCQDAILLCLDCFLGEGASKEMNLVGGTTKVTENYHFTLPPDVGRLMGFKAQKTKKLQQPEQSRAMYACDVIQTIAGIQQYLAPSSSPPEIGFHPTNIGTGRGTIREKTTNPIPGKALLMPNYWNQVPAWSIMQQYLNRDMNEMYTCFRVNPNGAVVPTLIIRQIPFTTDFFDLNLQRKGQVCFAPTTKFSSLPRWRLDENLILDSNLGREESARFNMIQTFGYNTLGGDQKAAIKTQIAMNQGNNMAIDKDDITRHGLRPIITTSQFDLPVQNGLISTYQSPEWTKIRGDWLIGGHLKENGSITTFGIPEPICEGDNFQLNDMLFHIEGIEHQATIDHLGKKNFRTILQLSNGVPANPTPNVQHNQMVNTTAIKERTETNAELGIGDFQDIPGRKNSEALEEMIQIDPLQKLKKFLG